MMNYFDFIVCCHNTNSLFHYNFCFVIVGCDDALEIYSHVLTGLDSNNRLDYGPDKERTIFSSKYPGSVSKEDTSMNSFGPELNGEHK